MNTGCRATLCSLQLSVLNDTQLAPHRCGIFVDPGDVTAVVDAVDSILGNSTESRAMGLRGREAFEQRFNFDREAIKLVSVVLQLLGELR